MKIAYLTPTFPPYPGGIGVACYYTAREMARRGYSVEIFTPRYRALGTAAEERFQINAPTPFLRYGNAALLPQLLWRLKNFDIVHCYYPFFGGLEFAAMARKYSSFRLILHHEMDTEGEGLSRFVFYFHQKLLLPRILKAVDRLLVLSEDYFFNSYLYKIWEDKTKIPWSVVPNGVDTDLFTPKERDDFHSPPRLMFAAGLDRAHYFKGVPVLFEAISILVRQGFSVSCAVVGEGELKAKYQSLALELGIGNFVEFTGFIGHGTLPDALGEADLFIMPSTGKTESFSIATVEAQSCGVPALVSNLPGLRATIEDGKTGLVFKKGDAQDLASKIRSILANKELWKSMRGASRARAVANYSWKKIGDRLEEIYRHIT